jgi:hypothetical protein
VRIFGFLPIEQSLSKEFLWRLHDCIVLRHAVKNTLTASSRSRTAADEDAANNEDSDVVALPDTDLPATEGATGKKRGRKALPENLPPERVEYDLPDDQKACPCCWPDVSHW